MKNTELENQIQNVLRQVFQDDSLVFDKSYFAGGLTNYNYVMNIHGEYYVIREPGPRTSEIIDREAERINSATAAELGLNSEIIYFDAESGIKISKYISNTNTLTDMNPAAPLSLFSVAKLLHTIHDSGAPFENVFDWRVELEKYEDISRSLNGYMFSDYQELKDLMNDFLDEQVPRFVMKPCHNDTVPENFLMNGKTRECYLIDWEYSGMNDPAWDVAMYMLESSLSEEAVMELILCYYGTTSIGSGEIQKLKGMCLIQDLLWTVWAVIRHYSGDDYLDYISMRYKRFRRNVRLLSADPEYPLSELVK